MKSNNVQVFYLREQEKTEKGFEDAKGVPPVACIAYIEDDQGNVARGISICSEVDNWKRSEGRNRAIARARKAMGCKCNDQIIGVPVKGDPGVEILRSAGVVFLSLWASRFGQDNVPNFKVAYNPPLNEFEHKLLDTARQRRAEAATKPAGQPAPASV